MISFLNNFIISKNYYIIESSIFKKGSKISFKSIKYINEAYEIFTVKYKGIRYILKAVEDEEWKLVKYLINKKTKCPHLIEYYACICKGNKKYILMQKGETDLQKYFDTNPYFCKDIWDIMKICFESQHWMIHNLHLVNRDLKLNNLIRLADGNIRIIDLELMESIDDIHKPDIKDLRKRRIDNQMHPRRRCNFQQFAYFSIAIIFMELLPVSDSLLTGRHSDVHLCDIIDDLSLLNNYPDLSEFFKKLIQLDYAGFDECYQDFVILYNKYNDLFELF